MLLPHELTGHLSNPALVLIHGITDNRAMWHPLLERLAADHVVLAVDLRGHGESEDGDAYDPISYASDVVETAASLGIADAIVVGHSLGGVVASAVAAISPCRAVVNIDQPLRLSGFKEALGQLTTEQFAARTDTDVGRSEVRVVDVFRTSMSRSVQPALDRTTFPTIAA